MFSRKCSFFLFDPYYRSSIHSIHLFHSFHFIHFIHSFHSFISFIHFIHSFIHLIVHLWALAAKWLRWRIQASFFLGGGGAFYWSRDPSQN